MQPKFFLQENKYDYQKCEFGDSLWNYKCDSGQPIGWSGFCRKIQCGKVIADQCADEPEIAKRKTFYVKVMTVEEAILQMEMLGHTFFMYRDGDTGEIDVVYKRRDGKYGVLEPEGWLKLK